MKRQSVFCHLMALVCAISLVASLMLVPSALAQSPARLGRPSSSDLQDLRDNSQDTNYNSNDTGVLPANAQYLPKGWVLIVELDSELKSSRSKVGDRFNGRVVVPVYDETGNVVIPINTTVDGHVSAVRPAQWRRRSGIIGIQFDSLVPPFGRPVPVRGELTSADAEERRRLEKEEDSFKGKEPIARHVLFIGGGATVGATLGWIGGSALLGGGAGAAAGLAATLLMKGKDVSIEPGQRFGMLLTQQISSNLFQPNATPIPTPIPAPIPTPIPGPYYPTPTPTPIPGTLPGPLNPYDATVLREGDGSVKLRVNAEAPSAGWRVYSNHENLANGVVRIRLRGTPPRSNGSSYNPQFLQTAIIPVPEICLDDKSGLLRRAEFMDKHGRSSFSVEIPYQPGNRYGRAPASTPYNTGTGSAPYNTGTGSSNSGGYPPSGIPTGSTPGTTSPGTSLPPPTSSLAVMAKSAADKVDVIRGTYAPQVGYYINRSNNTATFVGSQQPTTDQKQFFDGLMALYGSLLRLQNSSSDANTVHTNAQRVQEDANFTNQAWRRVSLDANLNSRWQAAYAEINTLLSAASR